jgi:uncharacterized protein
MNLMSEAMQALRCGNFLAAQDILHKLARLGSTAAFIRLGELYEIGGDGVPSDLRLSRYWYERAFQADLAAGAAALGRMYYTGQGVPIDYEKAYCYFSKLRNSHRSGTIYRLGVMYELGQGTPKDSDLARECYRCAAKLGNVFALKNLGVLEIRNGNLIVGAILWGYAILKCLWVAIFKGLSDPNLRRG